MSLSLSCGDRGENNDIDDDNDALICYSFDERKCGADAFSDANLASLSEEGKSVHIAEFLESKGVEIEKAKTVNDFHEVVCKACEVCPETYRFFIQIEEEDILDFKALNLFNIEAAECF